MSHDTPPSRSASCPAADGVIHLVFSADNVMAIPLAAAIASAAATLAPDRRLDVHVLDCGVAARNRRRVAQGLADGPHRLSWIPVEAAARRLLQNLYVGSTRHYPPSAYARLLMGELLPAAVTRVLYLDADTIVLRDLAALWETPLGGAVMGAIADLPRANGCSARLAALVDQAVHPYDADIVYVQSGVMLIDLAAFRAEGLGHRAVACLTDYPMLTFPDQDALNLLVGARRQLLDPRWNQMSSVYWDGAERDFGADELAELRDRPFIVHYSGRPKPWELGCRHPLADRWFAALARTSWAGWRPTRVNRAVAWAPRGLRLAGKKLSRLLRAR